MSSDDYTGTFSYPKPFLRIYLLLIVPLVLPVCEISYRTDGFILSPAPILYYQILQYATGKGRRWGLSMKTIRGTSSLLPLSPSPPPHPPQPPPTRDTLTPIPTPLMVEEVVEVTEQGSTTPQELNSSKGCIHLGAAAAEKRKTLLPSACRTSALLLPPLLLPARAKATALTIVMVRARVHPEMPESEAAALILEAAHKSGSLRHPRIPSTNTSNLHHSRREHSHIHWKKEDGTRLRDKALQTWTGLCALSTAAFRPGTNTSNRILE